MANLIIHIDDNPADLRLFEEKLKRERPDLVYQGFVDVAEALLFAASDPPMAFVLDHNMPRFDADTAVPRLRRLFPNAVCVIWTAIHPTLWGTLQEQGVQFVQKGDGEIEAVLTAIERAKKAPILRSASELLKNGRWVSTVQMFFKDTPIPVFFVWTRQEDYGKIGWCNDAAQSLFGWTEAEFRRMTFMDFTVEADTGADLLLFNQLLQKQINNYTLTKRWLTKRTERTGEYLSGTLFVMRHPVESVVVSWIINSAYTYPDQPEVQHAPSITRANEVTEKRPLDVVLAVVSGVVKSKNPISIAVALALLLVTWWLTFGGGLRLLLGMG